MKDYKRNFMVIAHASVLLPYEESLLEDKINSNHLMYLAQAEIDKKELSKSHKLTYETYLSESWIDDEDDKFRYKETPLDYYAESAVKLRNNKSNNL